MVKSAGHPHPVIPVLTALPNPLSTYNMPLSKEATILRSNPYYANLFGLHPELDAVIDEHAGAWLKHDPTAFRAFYNTINTLLNTICLPDGRTLRSFIKPKHLNNVMVNTGGINLVWEQLSELREALYNYKKHLSEKEKEQALKAEWELKRKQEQEIIIAQDEAKRKAAAEAKAKADADEIEQEALRRLIAEDKESKIQARLAELRLMDKETVKALHRAPKEAVKAAYRATREAARRR